MELVEYAARLAIRHHGDQTYGRGALVFPYAFHLARVVSRLLDLGVRDEQLLAAAWLHDILEDTDFRHHELVDTVGKDVADIVFAVTGIGHNRKTRNANWMEKVRTFPNSKPAIIKLADRYENIRHCVLDRNTQMFDMYYKEHPAFVQSVVEPWEYDDNPLVYDMQDDLHILMFMGQDKVRTSVGEA